MEEKTRNGQCRPKKEALKIAGGYSVKKTEASKKTKTGGMEQHNVTAKSPGRDRGSRRNQLSKLN